MSFFAARFDLWGRSSLFQLAAFLALVMVFLTMYGVSMFGVGFFRFDHLGVLFSWETWGHFSPLPVVSGLFGCGLSSAFMFGSSIGRAFFVCLLSSTLPVACCSSSGRLFLLYFFPPSLCFLCLHLFVSVSFRAPFCVFFSAGLVCFSLGLWRGCFSFLLVGSLRSCPPFGVFSGVDVACLSWLFSA